MTAGKVINKEKIFSLEQFVVLDNYPIDGEVVVKLSDLRALYDNAPSVGGEDFETLKKFYSVDTLEGLIKAQANHIERLQEKIKIDMPVRMPNPRAF